MIACSVWAGDAAFEIPETRTYGELMKLAPIELGGGVKVRLGIEAKTCPRFSGVLLYCLAEGYEPPETYKGPDIRIGPVFARVWREDGPKTADGMVAESRQKPPDEIEYKRCKLLFLLAVTAGKPGKYVVEISRPNGALAARCVVDCQEKPFHPWMPLARDSEPLDALKPAYAGDTVVAHVENRADGIALPRFDPANPLIVEGPNIKHASGDPLPSIFPSVADAGFKLSLNGKREFVIESDVEFLAARPDWHFLTRWWVNDKPYVPKQLKPYGDQNGLMVEGKKLRLRMKFDSGRIGATKGDKIGLQLLHCRNGWELVTDHGIREMHAHDGKAALLMSNRIDFIAP